jgi:hypothetical protein
MTASEDSSAALLEQLHEQHGPFVGGKELRKLLGFKTYYAFRQADIRGQLPVKTFSLPHRQGKFALTEDVAKWLSETIQNVKGGNIDSS